MEFYDEIDSEYVLPDKFKTIISAMILAFSLSAEQYQEYYWEYDDYPYSQARKIICSHRMKEV